MVRLDVALVQRGVVSSRTVAAEAIAAEFVTVNGAIAHKASMKIVDSDDVQVKALPHNYVGRGGVKLAHALACFGIDVGGRVALDVGASTGGFTDCLLQNGAARVYAVDVGKGQLHKRLRADERVVAMEQTDIRGLALPELVDLIVVDVSFISLTRIIDYLAIYAKSNALALLLVKPQFETSKSRKNKHGVVIDKAVREIAVQSVAQSAEACGWRVLGREISPLAGGDGNIEYFLHASR
ncbi:MAG: TlyA family RNA methyltransferase [Oscillospiraceae bacterium]|nr:TlyA family RNA methyltransferase [Oscillospiraceae bacterium]